MDVLIFIGRLLLTVLLYVFLGALFVLLWRDLQTARRQVGAPQLRERPGQLRVTRAGGGLAVDQVIPLSAYTTLGRAEANTVVVADPYASAEHAVIAWRSGQWWLEDRDSRNGTLLNDIPVEEPLIIGEGDVIGIGQARLRFEYVNGNGPA